MDIWYTATEKFSLETPAWTDYIAWAGLPQLREVVSLDGMLCPSIFNELTEEDWQHNIQQDYRITYFRDLAHVRKRAKAYGMPLNILALVYEPDLVPKAFFENKAFAFCGYDLLEEGSGISALTNCGGFAKAFDNHELSPLGLLDDFEHARRVQENLRTQYPDEPHADCDLWALWRLKE